MSESYHSPFDAARPVPENARSQTSTGAERSMKAYMCIICGFIYEEEKGHPETGVEPGTKWEDVPLNWQCPDCGAGKEDFEMIEI